MFQVNCSVEFPARAVSILSPPPLYEKVLVTEEFGLARVKLDATLGERLRGWGRIELGNPGVDGLFDLLRVLRV